MKIMKSIISIIMVVLCFILVSSSVSADSEDRQWQTVPSMTCNFSFGNTSYATTPTLPPLEIIDEVEKPNRAPLYEQLKLLQIWASLTTIVTLVVFFILRRRRRIERDIIHLPLQDGRLIKV
jgi:hypothetical protein